MSLKKLSLIIGIFGALAAIYFPVANANGWPPFKPAGPPGNSPRIVQFDASPESISSGQSSVLVWKVDNATTVTISPEIGGVASNGQKPVSPSKTTRYSIIAKNGSLTAQATTVIQVNLLPDLVLKDILVKPKSPGYGTKDDMILNTVVLNQGANCQVGFIVRCSYTCSGNLAFFSGQMSINGLSQGQEATLGDNNLLNLGDCSFASKREFT